MKKRDEKAKERLKGFCHTTNWSWDYPFPGDLGEDGRWELSLYSIDDLTQADYVGYVAIAPLENGEWAVIFTIDEEEERFWFTRPTLQDAKCSLDRLLAANTPDIPADRDAADPWLGEEDQHEQLLWQLQRDPEFAQQLKVDAILKGLPRGSSPLPCASRLASDD